jgi:hypothetical protein
MHGEEGNIAGLLLFYFSGVYQSMALAQQSNGNTFESSLDVHFPALKDTAHRDSESRMTSWSSPSSAHPALVLLLCCSC